MFVFTWPGASFGDPAEGGGPAHGLTVAAGQPEGHAELPQPARGRAGPHLPGGEGAQHQQQPRPPGQPHVQHTQTHAGTHTLTHTDTPT